MTEVTFYQSKSGELTGFRVEGHAGFDFEGKDIVCAGVSALVINTVNSIEELTDDAINVDSDEEECYIDVSFFDTPGKEAQLLLKSLALGLSNMKDDETVKEFISIIFEEEIQC